MDALGASMDKASEPRCQPPVAFVSRGVTKRYRVANIRATARQNCSHLQFVWTWVRPSDLWRPGGDCRGSAATDIGHVTTSTFVCVAAWEDGGSK